MKKAPRKLVGALACVLLLAVVTSPLVTVWLIRREASDTIRGAVAGLTSSGLAHVSISEGFVETAVALTSDSAQERTNSIARIKQNSSDTDAYLQSYESTVSDEVERRLFDELMRARKQFVETRARVFDLLEKDRRDEAMRLFGGEGLVRFEDYFSALESVVRSNTEQTLTRGRRILDLCNGLLIVQGVLLIFFLVYGFYVPLIAVWERLTFRSDEPTDI